jgi:hypothetical protein
VLNRFDSCTEARFCRRRPDLLSQWERDFIAGTIPVFRRADGTLSVGVPSAPQLDREGRVKLKPDGKREYKASVSFETPEGRDRWQRLVLGALADAGVT